MASKTTNIRLTPELVEAEEAARRVAPPEMRGAPRAALILWALRFVAENAGKSAGEVRKKSA